MNDAEERLAGKTQYHLQDGINISFTLFISVWGMVIFYIWFLVVTNQ